MNKEEMKRSAPSSSGSEKIQKRKEGKGKGPTIAVEGKGKTKVVIKGKCFHCNVDEHWKINCPKYLVKKKEKECKYDLLVLETCLMENDQNAWILDSRATNHVCSSLQETSSFKQLEESEMTLKVGMGDVISAHAVGELNDYSRYGYLYLMEHKSEALEKFKEYKAEVENLLSKKIKILRSNRGGEYMDLRFQNYMIEHGIQSQLSAPGTPQQNGVSERRNRTLLDMVRSMMSYTQLPSSFWGYTVETAVHILNNVPSKSVSETPFELWREQTRGGLFFDPQENRVFVSTNATFSEEDHMRDHKPQSKLVLNEATDESTRVVYEVGPSSRVDETTTSGQSHPSQSLRMPRCSGRVAMNDVDKDQWVKAMDLEMESMYFNSVCELVDLPEGVKPIGCKWIYKRKKDSAGKVQTFKARHVAKGYTHREVVDCEETFSPVAMLKSIRILLSIVTFYDYEIWQMDVKTAFLNDNLEESIFMSQPEGFITQGQEQKVCKLNRSIYGLKQASRSWNIRFDTAIKSYGFDQNVDEPCVYKKINKGKVAFLVLYLEYILLIGNDVGYLTDVKAWLAAQFQNERFRRGIICSWNPNHKGSHGVHLSKEQCPKTPQEVEDMRRIPYASAVGSLMYVMLCTMSDICYAVGIVSRYQSNPRLDHWTVVKIILKYLRRTRNYMLVYGAKDLILTGYTDSDFQTDKDSRKFTSGSVFT
ncbi:gag/pol protein [Cucumis melo var. makuwa]|uniref:Gag/pol protein n=1 Tax=Cucumis melo var. makuwa TaxID=1194695 RepID=A0A5D3BIR3_CUCMM|nr:gag/pol protein [Cucumis melo var. makuwa]